MTDPAHDKDLLRRIGTGDRAAMREFYTSHQRGLTAFARARGMDAATAADVVQDTMLDVWRSAGRYRGDAAAKTWLFTIAHNKIVDRVRKNARVQYVDEVPDAIDETPDPEAITVSVSEAGRLRACLDRLKEAHKTVMRLAFYEDLSYDEIAEIEGVPNGTIKTRVFHAKKLLLRCLGTR
ncbi:MAG: RNA polymerase sigma factor [Tateyamaria sp.]